MNIRSILFALLLLVLSPAPRALAGTITSTGSLSISLSPNDYYYSDNYALSSSIYYSGYGSVYSPTVGFTLAIPGVSLPPGSTIQSATLSFLFPSSAVGGGMITTYLSPVDAYSTYSCGFFSTCYTYYPYDAPTYNVTGFEYGSFSSVMSPHDSSGIANLSGGTLNLLSLGFGPDLLAGDGLMLSGNASAYSSFYYTSFGYNAYSTTYLYSNTFSDPYATLDIQYRTAEPGTLILLGISLFGIAAFAARERLALS